MEPILGLDGDQDVIECVWPAKSVDWMTEPTPSERAKHCSKVDFAEP